MTFVDVTFFESKSYFEFESSVLESGDDESIFLLNLSLSTNASSLKNNELEHMPPLRINLSRCINDALHILFHILEPCQRLLILVPDTGS